MKRAPSSFRAAVKNYPDRDSVPMLLCIRNTGESVALSKSGVAVEKLTSRKIAGKTLR
jgi:hypothetical protein